MPEVIFTGPAGRLEGRYHPAKQKNAPIAMVLHPHPQFHGTMNHQIIYQCYYAFAHRLEFYVNDIGMVFFFALATKEIVEATTPGGALHTWRRAALPAVAAIGGMIVPALIYVAYVHSDQEVLRRGWAIPCATDSWSTSIR